MVVAQLVLAMEQHRHEFVPARFEFGMLVHVDDLDLPAVLGGDRLQRRDQVVAQVAPLAAQYREAL